MVTIPSARSSATPHFPPQPTTVEPAAVHIPANPTATAGPNREVTTAFALAGGVFASAEGASVNAEAISVNAKMASVNTEVASVNAKMTFVNNEATSVNAKMTSVNNEATSVNAKMTSVNNEAASVNTKMTFAKAFAALAPAKTPKNITFCPFPPSAALLATARARFALVPPPAAAGQPTGAILNCPRAAFPAGRAKTTLTKRLIDDPFMKKCSYCGKVFPDEAVACNIDGQALFPLAPALPQPAKARSTRKLLTYIDPVRAGIVLGALYGILASLFVLVVFIATLIAHKVVASNPFGGSIFLIFVPVLYGAFGFISGIIVALLYNLIAKFTGGIAFEFRDAPPAA